MSVLFVLTSHDILGDTGRKTGMWLEEFLVPYFKFIDAGLPIVLSSPKGGKAPIDPASVEAIKDSETYARFAGDKQLQDALDRTVRLSDVDSQQVSAVVYPGGHGPLWDLRTDSNSIALISALLSQNKPVATICHAGCALLDVKKSDGTPLVEGLRVTAFSDSEEAAVAMENHVPYLVETELKKLGASYSKATDWADHSVQDGLIITGQNPASSSAVAEKIIGLIR